jgi:hypothetical protein
MAELEQKGIGAYDQILKAGGCFDFEIASFLSFLGSVFLKWRCESIIGQKGLDIWGELVFWVSCHCQMLLVC